MRQVVFLFSRRRPHAAARDNFCVQVSETPLAEHEAHARSAYLQTGGYRGFKWSSLTLHSRQRLPVQLPFILAEEELVSLELVHGVVIELVGDGVGRAHHHQHTAARRNRSVLTSSLSYRYSTGIL